MTQSMKKKSVWMLALGLMAVSQSAFAAWSVIVFNTSTGKWGSYQSGATRDQAEYGAMDFCGADCQVSIEQLRSKTGPVRETYSRDGWVAYARSAGSARWGTAGDHSSRYNAEMDALSRCGLDDCYIVRSTSPYEDGTRSN